MDNKLIERAIASATARIYKLADGEKWGISELHQRKIENQKEVMEVTVEALQKFAEYKDAEEQGLLLRLPCKVGDTVYVIAECENIPTVLDGTLYDSDGSPGTATGYYCPYEDECPHECIECEDLFDCDNFKNKNAVFEDEVGTITISEMEVLIGTQKCGLFSRIGEFIFLTKEEAEAALAKMKG